MIFFQFISEFSAKFCNFIIIFLEKQERENSRWKVECFPSFTGGMEMNNILCDERNFFIYIFSSILARLFLGFWNNVGKCWKIKEFARFSFQTEKKKNTEFLSYLLLLLHLPHMWMSYIMFFILHSFPCSSWR